MAKAKKSKMLRDQPKATKLDRPLPETKAVADEDEELDESKKVTKKRESRPQPHGQAPSLGEDGFSSIHLEGDLSKRGAA